MATTYEIPSTMHKHVHSSGGRQRGLSHSRKSGPQLTPSQFAAINNGGVTANGCFTIPTPINESPPIREAHHYTTSSTNTVRAEPQTSSSLQLPKPTSFSSPNMERSKSWERRKSIGLPTHLRLQNNDYSFHATGSQASTQEAGPTWISTKEIISALLVPLPCVLASLAYGFGIVPRVLKDTTTLEELAGSVLEKTAHPEDRPRGQSLAFAMTFGLTAGTLLLIGLKGKYTQALGPFLERRKSHGGMTENSEPQSGMLIARKMTLRVLAVGLPLYAISELGIRVSLIMLVAMASNIMTQDQAVGITGARNLTQLLNQRKYAVAAILLQLLCDLGGFTNYRPFASIFLAYLALGVSVLILPPPYPSHTPKTSPVTSNAMTSARTTSAVLSTPWETTLSVEATSSSLSSRISPLVCTALDVDLTIYSGAIMGAITTIMFLILRSSAGASSSSSLVGTFLTPCAGALALTIVDTKSLWTTNGFGLVIGSLASCLALTSISHEWSVFAYQSILIGISFAAIKFDTHAALYSHSHHDHRSHQHESSAIVEPKNMSRFSAFLLFQIRGWRLLEQIIAEKDSRRIFYFMCLNFGFMLIQTFYGIATGSLGLLSDSIHMFFDCLALVVGLCAAVMSKWPPSVRFPYGYGKMDTLAGFANGIFLMLISIEIVYEALERLAEGVNIQRLGELLTVSFAGLVVNLVGMLAFGHAHHGHGHAHEHALGEEAHDHSGHSHAEHKHEHSHHDHGHEHCGHEHYGHEHCDHDQSHRDHSSHGHSHSEHSDLNPSPQNFDIAPLSAVSHHSHLHDHLLPNPSPSPSTFSSVPGTPSKPAARHAHDHSHGHSHGHHHHHGNENMHGIFLHVLADTLGSVAVVISTLLIHFYGWSGFDPIASCLIAVLIFASAVPLVQTSASKLLMSVPEDTEYELRETLAGVAGLRGVVGYAVPKFWIDEGSDRSILGAIHVIAGKSGDLDDVKERCIAYLRGRGMDVLVQVEREGSGRCWCQATRPAQGF